MVQLDDETLFDCTVIRGEPPIEMLGVLFVVQSHNVNLKFL